MELLQEPLRQDQATMSPQSQRMEQATTRSTLQRLWQMRIIR